MNNKQRQKANAMRRAEAAKKQTPLPIAEQAKRAEDRQARLARINALVNRELAEVHKDAALGKDRMPSTGGFRGRTGIVVPFPVGLTTNMSRSRRRSTRRQ